MGSVNQELKLIQNKYSLPLKGFSEVFCPTREIQANEEKQYQKVRVAAVTLTWHGGSEAFRTGLWEPSGKV